MLAYPKMLNSCSSYEDNHCGAMEWLSFVCERQTQGRMPKGKKARVPKEKL